MSHYCSAREKLRGGKLPIGTNILHKNVENSAHYLTNKFHYFTQHSSKFRYKEESGNELNVILLSTTVC
jgi:hypothetical protein